MSARRIRNALVPAVLALFLIGASAGKPVGEPLPVDLKLVRGALDNGLSYIIQKHSNPPGRVSLWLHVATGSLNETDETRGIAHYLEHMAFNGSANFPPGSLIPFFQSLGLSFGRDQNAFTSYGQTTYQLALPDTKPENLDKGLLYLSDVALRLSLNPAEIESERQIILEERRSRAGPRQRVEEYIYERLAPESAFGRRLPIGIEATIKSVSPKDFRDYYARWYVPSNMTLIAVGECDPDLVAGLVRKHFSSGPNLPRPRDLDIGVKAQKESRAIVATDPELTQAEISIVRVEPPRTPTVTAEDYRRDLVESIGTRAFNRRISVQLSEGRASFLSGGVSVYQETRAIRITTAEASGKPADWRRMLADLATSLQRARLHGFGERELKDVRASLIADAEEAVQREETFPASTILRRINGALARREPVMSAKQRLELLKRFLPGITAAEVSQAFTVNFDPGAATFILETPSGGDVPTEAELVQLGRAALSVAPQRETERDRPTALMDKLPAGGQWVERSEHAASGVTSAWLDNGVRVHHRFMDQRKNEVTVYVTLAGGRIQESAANRGITDVAALGWNRPATGKLSSIHIRDLMVGKKVRVNGGADADTLTLVVSGHPEDLESGLQLATLLLTDPVVEAAAFEQWKEGQKQRIASRKLHPSGVLTETVAAAFYPSGEARTKPLETEQVERLKLDEAQLWLRKVITEAPVEVAVVGDLEQSKAFSLLERYLGSLPRRERIGEKTHFSLRKITRSPGAIQVERKIRVQTPQAYVMGGFFGADLQNIRDTQLLAIAARVLSTRMNVTLREEKQLVYSIGASSQPASIYPGFGVFVSRAPTDPTKTEALGEALGEMYTDFAKNGPTEDELTVAKKQIANLFDVAMKEPDFWLGRLSTLDYRGLKLDDVIQAPEEYQRHSAAEVRDAFARYYQPGDRFRFVIKPGDPIQPDVPSEKTKGPL